jgi:bifunctional UDP-N-acetylglucosamine pyrophosphorylase/glucosamine-1-phosphate N-acetyltransferase
VILAAGQGTRMKSPIPKVLHKVGGRTILDRVIDTVEAPGASASSWWWAPQPAGVRAGRGAARPERAVAVQDPPLGTGHAVLAARDALADFEGDLLVSTATARCWSASGPRAAVQPAANGWPGAVLASKPVDPLLYGRVIAAPTAT